MSTWQGKFLPDDFDRIYQKYFKRLKENNELKFDPSGWLNTQSQASDLYAFNKEFTGKTVTPYYSDYSDQLNSYKASISKLLFAWDNYHYPNNEYTLCSSVTLGSLILLSVLSKRNIQNVFFETPSYYASINQAKTLGMNTYLIPTYANENFSLKLNFSDLNNYKPYILWLTQPRMSLGINQAQETIMKIYDSIPKDCYIVIDEASEQLFPSNLSVFSPDKFPRILKIRNFYKGMGVNGIRLSFITHCQSFQKEIQREIENFQGAVDYFSLLNTTYYGENIDRFKLMMSIANEQTTSLRREMSRRYGGEKLSFSTLENGYIGTFAVDFSSFPFSYRVNRENLLKHCFQKGVSIILGATMKFAHHEQKEFVRVNYFKSSFEIEGALEVINNYLSE